MSGSDEEIPNVERTLAVWESPRKLQEQFDPRLYEISSATEPANAKFPDFLSCFAKEERLVITLGLAPAESRCCKTWAAVFIEKDRRMEFTGQGASDMSDQHVLASALPGALR
jgi:hypothetical protein